MKPKPTLSIMVVQPAGNCREEAILEDDRGVLRGRSLRSNLLP